MRVRIFANICYSIYRLFAFAKLFCLLQYFTLINSRKFPFFPLYILFNNLVLLHFFQTFNKLKKPILHPSCFKKFIK